MTRTPRGISLAGLGDFGVAGESGAFVERARAVCVSERARGRPRTWTTAVWAESFGMG